MIVHLNHQSLYVSWITIDHHTRWQIIAFINPWQNILQCLSQIVFCNIHGKIHETLPGIVWTIINDTGIYMWRVLTSWHNWTIHNKYELERVNIPFLPIDRWSIICKMIINESEEKGNSCDCLVYPTMVFQYINGATRVWFE